MNYKGSLYNMRGWAQFFFFCLLSFSGYILAMLVLLLTVDLQAINESVTTMRAAMLIQSVCLFFIPSLAFIYLCQEKPIKYLGLVQKQKVPFVLLTILLIIAIQPFIYSLSYYNQQLTLPESMALLENWMKESELRAEKLLHSLFVDKSVKGFILNFTILAIIAGIVEEFFFRGCLQQIIQKIVKNCHIAVWVTAFIFSAIHFQFYGFIPRFLLGALLGYLFVWSRNIWIPVLIHIAHNAINVIFAFVYFGSEEYEQLENFSFGERGWAIILSLLLSFLLLFFTYRNRIKVDTL